MTPPQGFVNLDKPAGITSRRAGETAARCFGRGVAAGHAGTLDPAATGVLPVAVGGATRLVDLIASVDKEYRGVIRLGLDTDTDDAEGKPLGPEVPVGVGRAEAERALRDFLGEVMQRPPRFSAVKRGGRAAHKLARAGKDPGLEPRPAVYRELEMLRFDPPELEVRALVGKGTYIRALARDLGAKLGCGGHLLSLRRTRVGSFAVGDAVSLERLKEMAAAGRAGEALISAGVALPEASRLTVNDPGSVRTIRRGGRLPLGAFAASGPEPEPGRPVLVLDAAGRALALGEVVTGEAGAMLQPRKRIR